MDQMLHVSSNPHVRDKMTTSKIMQLVAVPTEVLHCGRSIHWTKALKMIWTMPSASSGGWMP